MPRSAAALTGAQQAKRVSDGLGTNPDQAAFQSLCALRTPGFCLDTAQGLLRFFMPQPSACAFHLRVTISGTCCRSGAERWPNSRTSLSRSEK